MSETAPEGTGQGAGTGNGGEGSQEPTNQPSLAEELEKWKSFARKHESEAEKARKTAEANSAAARELATLKRQGQTEVERLTGDLSTVSTERDTLRTENSKLAKENARLKAGMAAGLSVEDMAFIPDLDDPAEMEKAAKTLAARLGSSTPPRLNGGAVQPPSEPKTMSDVIRAARTGNRSSRPM